MWCLSRRQPNRSQTQCACGQLRATARTCENHRGGRKRCASPTGKRSIGTRRTKASERFSLKPNSEKAGRYRCICRRRCESSRRMELAYPPPGDLSEWCGRANKLVFVIAKEACRLRQSTKAAG